MKPQNKLSHEQRQETETTAEQNLTAKAGLEFTSPEELLRHDAAQVVVPPTLAERLRESTVNEQPQASWWQRWFKK